MGAGVSVARAAGITLNGNWGLSVTGANGLAGSRRALEKTAATTAAAAKFAAALDPINSTIGEHVNVGVAGRVTNVANGVAASFDFLSTLEDVYYAAMALFFAVNPADSEAGEGTLVSSIAAERTRHALRAVVNFFGFGYADAISDINTLTAFRACPALPTDVLMSQQPVLAASFLLSGGLNIWEAVESRLLMNHHEGKLAALLEIGEELLDVKNRSDLNDPVVKRTWVAQVQGWVELVKKHDVAVHNAAKEVLSKSLSTASQWLAAGAIIAGIVGAVFAIAALTNPIGIAVIASIAFLSLAIELGRIAMSYLFVYRSKINFEDREKQDLFEKVQSMPILTAVKAVEEDAVEKARRDGRLGGGAAGGGRVAALGAPPDLVGGVGGDAAEQTTGGGAGAGAASGMM